MSMFQWDYRVINLPSTNGGEDYFALCEVTYDKKGKPKGYAPIDRVGEVEVEALLRSMEWMTNAMTKPVLHEEDFKQIPWGNMHHD